MRLVKEVIKESDFYKVTEYNGEGKVRFISKAGYGNSLKQEFFYNTEGKVLKVLEEEADSNYNQEKRLKFYEYNGEDYRTLTYLTHQRSYEDANSHEYMIEGIKNWHVVDKLVSVEEVKFKNSKKIYENYYNLITNERSEKTFNPEPPPPSRQTTRQVTSSASNNSYTETICDENSKMINAYENGLLCKTEFIYTHKGEEYLAFKEIYSYDNIKIKYKTEKFGRFNSKLILYKVIEEHKNDGVLETTMKEISHFADNAGFYDFKLMIESIDEDLRHVFKEDMYDNYDFDYCIKTIEHFDSKGNVINSTSMNPCTGEFYDSYLYHFEYNDEGLIEFEVTFRQRSEDLPMENIGIKRYYYV